MLFAGFGWGKPVQINPTNFKRPEKDSAKVALAGPVMNLILAVISAVIYALIIVVAVKTKNYTIIKGELEYNTAWDTLMNVAFYSMSINLGLAIFNLLPFPPLDGSKIFRAILKGKAKEILYSLEKYSMIIIMILFMTHAASYIISPIMEAIYGYVLEPIIYAILGFAL